MQDPDVRVALQKYWFCERCIRKPFNNCYLHSIIFNFCYVIAQYFRCLHVSSEWLKFTLVPKVMILHTFMKYKASMFYGNLKPSQIRIWWSGTRKCLQRYEINNFCPGNIAAIQSLKFRPNPVRELLVLRIQFQMHM